MALASKTGNYAGDKESIGSDVEATFDSIIARVNAVTIEQMGTDSVSTTQLVNLSVTLGKLADAIFPASAAGRAKFADKFITRTQQANEALGAGSYVRYEERQPNGTHAGSSVGGGFNKRSINTLVQDIASIGAGAPASGLFVLPAGTYQCSISTVAYAGTGAGTTGAGQQVRLRNTTASTTMINGLSTNSSIHADTLTMTAAGQFTVAASQNLSVEVFTANTQATFGLGHFALSGAGEVYCIAEFWKVG